MKSKKRAVAIVLALAIVVTLGIRPAPAKAAANKYLVLVEQEDGSWIPYNNLAEKSTEGAIMVRAKATAAALGYSYKNLGNGSFRIIKNGVNYNTYTKNSGTYGCRNGVDTVDKTTDYAPYTSATGKVYVTYAATLSNLCGFRYYRASQAPEFKKLGYAGVLCYSTRRSSVTLPDAGKVDMKKMNRKSKKVTFYIIRHGETQFNTQELAQGWCDSPLTQNGVTQAIALGKGLGAAKVKFVSAYTSTSERAMDTANNVLENSGNSVAPVLTKDLREMYYGTLEGGPGIKLFDDFEKRFTTGWPDFGGETWEQLGARSTGVLTRAVAENKASGGNVLISTHGMTVSEIVKEIAGDSPVYADLMANNFTGFSNCSVTILEWENGVYTLKSANDVSYRDNGMNME